MYDSCLFLPMWAGRVARTIFRDLGAGGCGSFARCGTRRATGKSSPSRSLFGEVSNLMVKKLGPMLVALVVLLVLAVTAGAAPTTLRADLNAPGNPVAVGWVESSFPESATVHLTGALPNTDFVLASQYWTGTATCGGPGFGGVAYTGSLRTDGSGNGVGQFLYKPVPEGISLLNWGVGRWIGPGEFDYQWDYWSNCVTVPTTTAVEFTAMNAQAMMLLPKGTANDSVGMVATFKLGTSSNRIDPATEPVKIDIGSLSLTLPPGSFKKASLGWTYRGQLNGIQWTVALARLSESRYVLTAAATRLDLTRPSASIDVSIAIGDDSGSTSVHPLVLPRR